MKSGSRVLGLCILIPFLLSACQFIKKDKEVNINFASLRRISSPEYVINPSEVHDFLLKKCDLEKDNSFIASSVSDFYQTESKFLWLGKYVLQSQADSLLNYLENSNLHGLNPELFSLSKVKNNINKIAALSLNKKENINKILAELEYDLTIAYVRYTCGFSFGFVDPHKVLNNLEDEYMETKRLPNGEMPKKELYSIRLRRYDKAFVDSVLNAAKDDAALCLRGVQSSNPFYIRLQKEYAGLLPLKETLLTQVPYIGDTLLKEGDRHWIIPFIAHRLSETGELGGMGDSDFADRFLTPELLKAINRFRRENLMNADNSIGNHTIRALNRPVDYYLRCLRVNMERLRWHPVLQKGDKYVLVNIAASMLQAIDTKVDTVLEMRICVGTLQNKTPLLASSIRYMEMNPYWNVPQSIIMREMIPAYRKDSSYFSRNRLKIYDKEGRELSPHDINWTKYEKGVPFDIKQDNKEGNSLGRIIFRFPNTHDIYLHDTPARYAFRMNKRAISHGCIRLANALDFAFFLLDRQDEMVKDKIRLAMGLPAQSEKGKKLKEKEGYEDLKYYSLAWHIPVFVEYYTNYLSPEGELNYCDDIYEYDSPLLEALDGLVMHN